MKARNKKQISKYAKVFDQTSPLWRNNIATDLLFLKAQQNWANDMLKARGHVFLNEVYDALGLARTVEGAVVGWMFNEDDENFIDFNIPTREYLDMSKEEFIVLDFNVDGSILFASNFLKEKEEMSRSYVSYSGLRTTSVRDMNATRLSIGDTVKFIDNSWSHKLTLEEGLWSSWSRNHEYDLCKSSVQIMDLNLKVPAMDYILKTQDVDANDNPVYLDMMVKDKEGNLWLALSRFCFKIDPAKANYKLVDSVYIRQDGKKKMEINVEEGWARKLNGFGLGNRTYDIVLKRMDSLTTVWCDPQKLNIIKKVKGVHNAEEYNSNEDGSYYQVLFDPRYDRKLVEKEIMETLMKDLIENE